MLDYSVILQPAVLVELKTHIMIFSIENIQLKKIQERLLEILVTVLLESIDLFITVFDAHDN